MSRADRVYATLPTALQHAATSLYGCWWRQQRLGGSFRESRDGFARREWISADQWHVWQETRLRRLLQICGTTPYYSARWRELGMTPNAVREFSLAQLDQLPVLSKDVVRRDPLAFCPGGRRGRGVLSWPTSGSTGTPLVTYHARADLQRGLALRDARYRAAAGVDHSLVRATFGGRTVEPDPDSPGPYHRCNLAERQIYFSAYHLRPATVQKYVDALWRHRPAWLHGYASSLHELARLALEQGISCPPLQAVITNAEPVSERMRADVERAFGCRVTEEYGLVEEVCFALECERGSLHVSPDAGYVEILDAEGRPCAPGVSGEIVATGFLREAQVFVRYRTRDLAAWSPVGCDCGRHSPTLVAIEGRLEDFVVGANGERVRRLTPVLKNLPGIALAQFVQSRPGAVTVRLVSDGAVEDWVRDAIRDRLQARLGQATIVDVEPVTKLEQTARGKTRTVVSTVDLP